MSFEADLLETLPIIGEARARGDLLKFLARLRESGKWSTKGWPKREILDRIPGEHHLGERREFDALRSALRDAGANLPSVTGEIADLRVDLGQGDSNDGHDVEATEHEAAIRVPVNPLVTRKGPVWERQWWARQDVERVGHG